MRVVKGFYNTLQRVGDKGQVKCFLFLFLLFIEGEISKRGNVRDE